MLIDSWLLRVYSGKWRNCYSSGFCGDACTSCWGDFDFFKGVYVLSVSFFINIDIFISPNVFTSASLSDAAKSLVFTDSFG